MIKFEHIEDINQSLEYAFNAAGLQDRFGKAKKPYYFRNSIEPPHEKDSLVLRYTIIDAESKNADNDFHSVRVYISAVLFINHKDGFDYAKYRALIKEIESKAKAAGWSVKYGPELNYNMTGDATAGCFGKTIEFAKHK